MTSEKVAKIRLLLLDVDGVLTDGAIIYDGQGQETKHFNAKDGLGLRLLMQAGIQVGIVSGRRSRALSQRCENLNIKLLFDGVQDKAAALDEIVRQTGIPADQTAFVGDDLTDLPVIRKVGLGVAVADAHELVKTAAHMVTRSGGGRGAVREVCEAILKAQGLWEQVIKKWL
jgi:3-deoxy-D-manno-octulosonate 8-phosphate phosphatase (KDO 8-P phosphatase)